MQEPTDAFKKYAHLTRGGEIKINLTRQEACVVLKIYDHGILSLDNEDGKAYHSILAKLKDQIWP